MELLGPNPRLPGKNLSSLGRGGGELEVPKWHLLLKKTCFFCFFQLVKIVYDSRNSTKKVQFEFLHLSEPPSSLLGSKLRPLPKSQKIVDRKNRVFISKKMQLKGLILQIRTQKFYLAQRSEFRPKWLNNFA